MEFSSSRAWWSNLISVGNLCVESQVKHLGKVEGILEREFCVESITCVFLVHISEGDRDG